MVEPVHLDHQARTATRTRLAGVPALLRDLELTLTRQHHVHTGNTGTREGRGRSFPLLFHVAAADAIDALELVLRIATARLSHGIGPTDPTEQAHWLRERLATAPDFLPELEGFHYSLQTAVERGFAVIDRPPDKLYLGSCETCHIALYADPDAAATACTLCGLEIDVRARQDQMLARVRYQYRRADELARLLPWVDDRPITEAAITKAGQRGTLHSEKIGGRVVYQIGDVLDWHRSRKAPAND